MGWNSWNCWSEKVDQAKVQAAAEAMVRTGLINYGWTYINIDDAWQGVRGGEFNAILPNEKFPDMKGLCDAVHAMGLKVGIYSTPWITSYANQCGGSSNSASGAWSRNIADGKSHGEFKFDARDVAQWAAWGIDYLKYDWSPNDGNSTRRMAGALAAGGRDIVYSLSNSAPISLAPLLVEEVNAYRTTGDIRDEWWTRQTSLSGYMGIRDIWNFHEPWAEFIRPGHFPDPDMLVVGNVGWGGTPHPTKLTPDEQYSHISLWCLWSAPLLIGCPIEEMSAFTAGLLTNAEVLTINQDSLCAMGRTTGDGIARIVTKPLKDGSLAVGLFNVDDKPQEVTAAWGALGISGKKRVRDLWRQKDIGEFDGRFASMVPAHGVVLVRVSD
jgi:alpha-galactosidase